MERRSHNIALEHNKTRRVRIVAGSIVALAGLGTTALFTAEGQLSVAMMIVTALATITGVAIGSRFPK